MKATLVMADAAEIADNKLYLLGVGATLVEPVTRPIAIGVLFYVSPKERSGNHAWAVELCDASGALFINEAGESVSLSGSFSLAQSVSETDYPDGVPIPVPVSINIGSLELPPGARFQWVLKTGEPLRMLAAAPFATRLTTSV